MSRSLTTLYLYDGAGRKVFAFTGKNVVGSDEKLLTVGRKVT